MFIMCIIVELMFLLLFFFVCVCACMSSGCSLLARLSMIFFRQICARHEAFAGRFIWSRNGKAQTDRAQHCEYAVCYRCLCFALLFLYFVQTGHERELVHVVLL